MEKKKAQETVGHCQEGCGGRLRSTAVTRVFRRRASPVELLLGDIPAEVCTVCGRAFFSRQTAREIDRLLAPFHGQQEEIPKLPPARVIVNFPSASKRHAA